MAEEIGPTRAPPEPELAPEPTISIVEQEGDWFWRAYDEENNMVNISEPMKTKSQAIKAAKEAFPDAEIK